MHVNVSKDFWNLFQTMIRCRCMCALRQAKEKGHVKRAMEIKKSILSFFFLE